MAAAVVVDRICKQYRLGELNRGAVLRQAMSRCFGRAAMVAPMMRRRFGRSRTCRLPSSRERCCHHRSQRRRQSTLLKILSRITQPTSGSMTVRGRLASLLEVGTGFHDELTGRENIYLNGSILGMKKREIDRHLDSIVDFAGVEQFLDTPVKRYSSGMRLRLGFAVAAHLEPDVLLVDEVLAVGTPGFRRNVSVR